MGEGMYRRSVISAGMCRLDGIQGASGSREVEVSFVSRFLRRLNVVPRRQTLIVITVSERPNRKSARVARRETRRAGLFIGLVVAPGRPRSSRSSFSAKRPPHRPVPRPRIVWLLQHDCKWVAQVYTRLYF